MVHEDRNNTARVLAQHAESGERYILAESSLWEDGACVGTRIIACTSPIYYGDLIPEGGPLEASAELFDRIDRWVLVDDDYDNAEWAQNEDAAGRLLYPLGARVS